MAKCLWDQVVRTCWLCAIVGLMVGSTTGEADAAGIFFPGNGARSAGKAGAVVATGDTADMVIHNPANLSRLRGFGLRFDTQLSFQKAEFTRQPEGAIVFDPVAKQDSPAFIPILALWYNLPKVGPGSLTLALFAHGPHGRSGYVYPEESGECGPAKEGDATVCTKMPEPGPNRGTLIKTQSLTLYMGLAVAYELRIRHDVRLRLGGAFRVQYVNAAQRQAMIAASNGAFYRSDSKKVTTGEVLVDVAADGVTFTGDVGLTLDMPLGFSVGASVFFPNAATLQGTIGVQIKSTLEILGVKAFGKDLEVITRFPMIFRAGVGWKRYGLSIEAAVVAEFWDGARLQTLAPKNVQFEALGSKIPIPAFEIDQNFKDSLSIRVGAEYNIRNWIWLRAGFIYETGALEENQVSVATVDYPNKMAITGGISGRIPGIGVMLDVSVMHIFGREITVTDSPLRPVDVSPDSLKQPGGVSSTSNGKYVFGMTGLFLGIRGNWGGSDPTNAIISDAGQGAK